MTRPLHVLLSLHLKLNGEHYELKIHENPANIFMAYSQDIQMFFMLFSGFYFSGFSRVWYHEKFINEATKTPLYHEMTLHNPLKFGVDF